MFEELLNKKVKVIMKDGFVKYGTLIKCENNFIKLLFKNNAFENINLDDVKVVKLDENNYRY